MPLTAQLAKHLRDVHTGDNWTTVDLRRTLVDVSWEQAIAKVPDMSTIATLVYHMSYFIGAVAQVLAGGPLDSKDAYSFDHPPIRSQADWEAMLDRVWADAERCACLIEQLPDERLDEPFVDGKYGTYYRNLAGLVEHMHYHLGQITLIKKLLAQAA